MKKIVLSLAVLFTTVCAIAQPPKGDANAGMTFGETVTAKDAIKADDLVKKLEKESLLEATKVEGVVNQVCAAEGCWLKMKTNGKDIMVRMKDHKFFVPLAMNGKTIVVQGTAQKKITSVEMLKHYAEDAGKSLQEIDAIKEPKEEVIIQATGIIVIK